MSIQNEITRCLEQAFTPEKLEVINESHLHAGHAGDDGSGESHFRLDVVSAVFEGKSRVERQRMVYQALSELMPHIHALAMKTRTPAEK